MKYNMFTPRVSRALAALAVCGCIPLTGAADYQATVLQDNPVGYWRLGENSGPTVTNLGSLGPAGDGVASDTVAFGFPGAITGDANTAAGFDGASSKIEAPYSDQLNPTNFTFEVWANVAFDSSGVYRSPISSRDDTPAGNTEGVIFYAEPGDTWQFWTGNASGGWDMLAGPTVNLGLWDHLVGTYDGTNKRFFVDGVLVGIDQAGFVPNRARPLRIGAGANENSVGQFFFNGQIDEPAVYNGVLSPDRILAHYKAGSGTDPIPVAPVIVADPAPVDTFTGHTVTLTPLVTGSLPLTYRWQLNGADLAGATGSSLVLSNAQPSNSGAYSVVVSNAGGEATSGDVAVTVSDVTKPVITEQPRPRTVLGGSDATLSVQASGSTTFTYQWQFKDADLLNATNSTLTITNVAAANTGPYRVIVTDLAGSTTSDEAPLQIAPPATKSYADTVKADNPVSYWRLDEPANATTAADSADSNPGDYLNGVTLGVPGALVGDNDTAAGFTATNQTKVDVPFTPALNTPQFTVELWAKVTGGSGTYRSPLTSRADLPQRGYIFYAEPGNTWQFWTGNGVGTGWDVIAGPAVQDNIWAHLAGVYDGTNQSFYVNGVLAGSAPAGFAPNDENGLRIGGGATEGDGDFFFQGDIDDVSFYDKALSEDRILAHYVAGIPQTTPPTFTLQPQSTIVPPGATVTFTAIAAGGLPLSYQWQLNNVAIPGATSTSLTVTNVQPANVGNYTLVVTNAGGSATSDVAKLELPAPATMSYPDTVKADGPVSYWRLDETSGDVAKDSIDSNDGTYLNGVILGLPGALTAPLNLADPGTAAGFQSTNQTKVDVPFSEALNPPANFSVELWAKVAGGSGYRSPLTSRGDFPPRGYIFYAAAANDWEFWTGNGDPGGWNTVAGPAVQTNVWTHLVGTFDGTNKLFYVNGVLVGSSTPTFGPNTDYPLRFGAGRTETDGDYFFDGDVDEVSFYNKVLTQAQVLRHFVAGRPIQVAPALSIGLANRQIILTWSGGTLQQAADITGTWQDVQGATSPLTVTPSADHQFYRVQ
jgi:Concanavalin A-like lectin/glucanases superfamily/Immunoglobulin domain